LLIVKENPVVGCDATLMKTVVEVKESHRYQNPYQSYNNRYFHLTPFLRKTIWLSSQTLLPDHPLQVYLLF
jgi:hypothetical protein